MRKEELALINDYCKKKDIVTAIELKQFISINFKDRDIKNINFYILDLKKSNIIYQLQTNIYKFCGTKQDFIFKVDDKMKEIWNDLTHEFSSLNLCIWQTSSVYDYMNLQPFKNYIFIEVERFAMNMIYDYLKYKSSNIILKSRFDLVENNTFDDNLIIVSNLLDEAPINKRYNTNRIGNNHYYNNFTIFPSPRIEKLLVDLYCDKTLMMFSKYGELINIYENILKNYKVDITKMLRYAKNRNSMNDIQDYIHNVINFNIDIGDFYDK